MPHVLGTCSVPVVCSVPHVPRLYAVCPMCWCWVWLVSSMLPALGEVCVHLNVPYGGHVCGVGCVRVCGRSACLCLWLPVCWCGGLALAAQNMMPQPLDP